VQFNGFLHGLAFADAFAVSRLSEMSETSDREVVVLDQ